MYFEAEANKKKYEVNVTESKDSWKVSIKAPEGEWKHHDIPKEDYQYLDETVSFLFKNSSYLVDVVGSDTEYTVYARGAARTIRIFNEESLLHESLKKGGRFTGGDSLTAGMPGKIVTLFVKEGDEVKENEPLLIMEAMKMENEMRADSDVKIKKICVQEGDNVESGALLITFEAQTE